MQDLEAEAAVVARKRGRPKKTRVNADVLRTQIKAQWLIRKLHAHVDGKYPMTMTQVRAADVLLRKVVPDVITTHIHGELAHRYVIEVPPMLSKEQWQERYRISNPEPVPALPWTIDQKGNGHTQ
jgi:hypothetical protein